MDLEMESYWRCAQPCLNRNEDKLRRSRPRLIALISSEGLECFHIVFIVEQSDGAPEDEQKVWSSSATQRDNFALFFFHLTAL